MIMEGRYPETDDHKVVWKYRRVVRILCDRESKASGGTEQAVESLQLPSHWMCVRQESEKGIVQWQL